MDYMYYDACMPAVYDVFMVLGMVWCG